jgi:adenylate cyclase
VDVKHVSRELGVLYVLEGSVRKAGNRIRITAQLLDASTGAHLWADRYDGALKDIFELQDNVASSVAGVIEPTLKEAEHHRSIQLPTDDLTAYDLYLRDKRLRGDRKKCIHLARRALRVAGDDPHVLANSAQA